MVIYIINLIKGYYKMTFEFEKQNIKDVILIKPKVFTDERGFFMETYKKSVFVANNIEIDFVQDNHSKSGKNVLRGLHFQHSPFEQAKLVRCVKGKIYDVAGFAHGFVSLSDEVELLYKTSKEYNLQADCGILWNDKDLNIDWGIDFEPILSDKDKNQKTLKELINEGIL